MSPNIGLLAAISGGEDAEDPRDVVDGVLEVGGHLAKCGDRDDGEHALHEVVVTALEDQGEGLVEDLISVGDNAPRGFFLLGWVSNVHQNF